MTLVDLNDFELPLHSIDREEGDGIPQLAHNVRHTIADADALLISFAEHNGNVTVAYKNLFDWLSRFDHNVFQDKPMVMLSTSPGGSGGSNASDIVTSAAPHCGGDVKATFTLPAFYANFDGDAEKLSNEEHI